MRAVGLNRSDVLLRSGAYRGNNPSGTVPGLEVAGVVETCGSAVGSWQVSDAVCTRLSAGRYAEYEVVDERHWLSVPALLTLEEVASLPEIVLTVWSTIFQRAQLRPGEHFLVHGGSSGIGLTAI